MAKARNHLQVDNVSPALAKVVKQVNADEINRVGIYETSNEACQWGG